MPYNTKALKTDVSGVKPAPQHFDPGIDDYDVALGRNGASRVELYGPDGNPLSTTEGKLAIQATEIETLLSALNGKDYSTLAKQNEILTKLAALETKLNSALDVQLSGSSMELYGSGIATRPAADTVSIGTVYMDVTGQVIYQSDGTNWVVM